MSSVLTHGTQKRSGSVRPVFVFALLGTLGVALAAFQTIQPVREAFGFDPLVRPVTGTSVVEPLPEAVETPEPVRFDRLASAEGVERSIQPVPTRRLGLGTRRAVRLASAVVQVSSAGSASPSAVIVQPVVAAMSSPSRTIQRPDSARRNDAPLGPVQYAKLDDALRRFVDGDPASPVRVIVQTQPGHQATTAQWLTIEGRAVHRLHPSIDGLTATLSASDVALLSEDPSIARLSIDAVVRASAEQTPGAVLEDTLLGLAKHGGVTSGGTHWAGKSIRVAVVDSGVTPSRDLSADRIEAFFDFTRHDDDQAVRLMAAVDDYGHGTLGVGLIGGSGDTSAGESRGPAWKVTFIGFKVLDEDGAGYTSDVLAAIEYVVQHNDVLGIDVMNLSLGHPIFEPAATDPLVQAVEAAVASGIVVVASAGTLGINRDTGEVGSSGVTSPGNAPAAITVGLLALDYTAMLGWGDLAGAQFHEGGT